MKKLTQKQEALLFRSSSTCAIKSHEGDERVSVIPIYGSGEHRSAQALADKGLISVGPIQPYDNYFIFATRKGQACGIGKDLSLTLNQRSEKPVTLNANERTYIKWAFEAFKGTGFCNSGADFDAKVGVLLEKIKLSGLNPCP